MNYLGRFYKELIREWEGSLAKPGFVRHRNAKEYLGKLYRSGKIDRIKWGWYYIPDKGKGKGPPIDFLRKDKNFKVLIAQTAASFWNGDFIHRNIYSLAVTDRSYKKALEDFGKIRGWNFQIMVINDRKDIKFVRINGLNVEKPAESVAECIRKWAFTDAFAVIYMNRKILKNLKKYYWKRVSGTDIRTGQIISYGIYGDKDIRIPTTLKKEINESIEKVKEFA